MKIVDLILEVEFFSYTGMVQFKHADDIGAEKLAELVRALPGVTRVSTAGQDRDRNIVTYNVKLISQKPAKEAYEAMKHNALTRFEQIKGVKIGINTLEKKGKF